MKIGRGCRDEEREEGKRNPFPPLFSPTPQFGSNLLFLAVSLTKGGRGEEESKKKLTSQNNLSHLSWKRGSKAERQQTVFPD